MYQRMKKIRVGIFFLLFLIASIVAIGTVTKAAFHSPTEEKDNLFQIGYLETKISEEFVSPATISPNETIPKKVRIENTGTVPQVIRLMVLPTIQKKGSTGSSPDELYPGTLGNEILLEGLDVVNWIDGGDGYYYYT